MDSAPGAALLIISGTASGETFFGPESRSTSWLCSSVPMPPMPVPMMQAIWVESYGSSPSDQPASAERLVARDHRELREAVGAARLLDRQVLLGLVLARDALAVLDS